MQASNTPGPRAPARLHLLLGPVGAGKSTLGLQLTAERGAVRLTLDEWMATLFRADRPREGLIPWYRERAERCVEQIWATALAVLATQTDVVLEIGLLTRQQRAAFWSKVCAAAVDLSVYVVDAPEEERWSRVAERNRARGPTFSAFVPRDVFDLASAAWEPVGEHEFDGATVQRFCAAEATPGGR